MSSAILDDIAKAIATAAIGQMSSSGDDWMIYKGFMPDNSVEPASGIADRAICLYETPGDPPLESWALDFPRFQVKVRSKPDDYQIARAKMQELFDFLHAGDTAVGSAYVYIYAMHSGIIGMGQDEKRRSFMATNFRLSKERE